MALEQVIGLEVHCQLLCHSKMFSAAPVTYGQAQNSQVSAWDMGLPGTLPLLNKQAVALAIRLCHILHMEIDELLRFDRKHYYYSDLPKGFQITQHHYPLGKNGYVDIETNGQKQRVWIERLHLEEDTAKQIHSAEGTYIDYNRSGIPLVEIVTAPQVLTSLQAKAYLEKLRQILVYGDISNAKMEEGSLRCDVNVSLRQVGQKTLGTYSEIKNLNSLSYVQKAIDYEVQRQKHLLLHHKKIIQETRRFDEAQQITLPLREKSQQNAYRYYPEVNMWPIRLNHQWVMALKDTLPMMSEERETLYREKHGLTAQEAHQLVMNKALADFYEEVLKVCPCHRLVCHFILGEVQAYLNKHHQCLSQIPLSSLHLGKLLHELDISALSSTQAKMVFQIMCRDHKDPYQVIHELGFDRMDHKEHLQEAVEQVLCQYPQSVKDYQKGKTKAIGFLIGQVMKSTHHQADPQYVRQLICHLLQKRTK